MFGDLGSLMADDGLADWVAKIEAIRRRRVARGVQSALSALVIGQLLFACFVFGAAQGPMPLMPRETLFGVVGALLCSLVLAYPAARRRMARGAEFELFAFEGRHRRRLLIFGDYLLLDREIVIPEAVQSVERDGTAVVLRYVDVATGTRALRELRPRREEDALLLLKKLEAWRTPERGELTEAPSSS